MSSPNLILEIIQRDKTWKEDGTSIYLINFQNYWDRFPAKQIFIYFVISK